MTVSHSLDAYLEPTRLSFSSPPISELQQGSEESYPVFSPLHQSRKQSLQSNVVPSGALISTTTAAGTTATTTTTTTSTHTLQPGSFVRQHRRQSSVNTVSWTDQGDATTGRRRLSTTLNPSNVSYFLLWDLALLARIHILDNILCLKKPNFNFINAAIDWQRKLMKRKWHWGVSIADNHHWVYRFEAMEIEIHVDGLAMHRLGDHVMLTMIQTNCQLALDAVDHVAGDLLVNFSTEIHCHSVIRNVRLFHIMNVISQK